MNIHKPMIAIAATTLLLAACAEGDRGDVPVVPDEPVGQEYTPGGAPEQEPTTWYQTGPEPDGSLDQDTQAGQAN